MNHDNPNINSRDHKSKATKEEKEEQNIILNNDPHPFSVGGGNATPKIQIEPEICSTNPLNVDGVDVVIGSSLLTKEVKDTTNLVAEAIEESLCTDNLITATTGPIDLQSGVKDKELSSELDKMQIDTNEVNAEVLESKPKSIIINLIKQLRMGTDLHRVTLPTFILEPRSLLERITDFMSHPCTIMHASLNEDPLQRFLSVLRYYLSAWHIRQKGVKKPYNPVLGEFFRCGWKQPPFSLHDLQGETGDVISSQDESSDFQGAFQSMLSDGDIQYSENVKGSTHSSSTLNPLQPHIKCPLCLHGQPSHSYYFSEQVSHHPPISAYLFCNPTHNLVVEGNFRPKSKFLGNSAVSLMHGNSQLYFMNRPQEVYHMTNPNIYIRGLFIGTMLTELGDQVRIECPTTGFVAEIDFQVKGYFTGSYNSISGKIFKVPLKSPLAPPLPSGKSTLTSSNQAQLLYTLSGKWIDKIYMTDPKSGLQTIFLDIPHLPYTSPLYTMKLSDQSPFESRRRWKNVTQSITAKDYDKATVFKSIIEEDQRLRTVKSDLPLDDEERKELVSSDGQSTQSGHHFVKIDKAVGIPLITRYFQSEDGVSWRFKYFRVDEHHKKGSFPDGGELEALCSSLLLAQEHKSFPADQAKEPDDTLADVDNYISRIYQS